MKVFLDTGDPEHVRSAINDHGFKFDGITTNPSLIKKAYAGRNASYRDIVAEFAGLGITDISAETIGSKDYTLANESVDTYMQEGMIIHGINPKIVTVKIPITEKGLLATRMLTENGVKVNNTLCFNVEQAILSAYAGGAYVSPFVGRVNDVLRDQDKALEKEPPKYQLMDGTPGIGLLEAIAAVYSQGNLGTQLLSASVRSVAQVRQSYEAGAHIITLPPKIFAAIANPDLREKGDKIITMDELREYQKTSRHMVLDKPAQLDHLDLSTKMREMGDRAFSHSKLKPGLEGFFKDGKEADVIARILASV